MYYTDSHEWVAVDDGIATIGITDYAQQELGDIVYVEFPLSCGERSAGDEVVILESRKAAIDICSPLSGEIIAVNHPALQEAPELINRSPQGEGWLFKIKIGDLGEIDSLLSEEEYKELTGVLDDKPPLD